MYLFVCIYFYCLVFMLNPSEILVPPSNFAMVESGIYRSGFPKKKNFPFLKRLGLKSVLFLCPEEYPKSNSDFLESIDAKIFEFGVQGNKEPFVEIPEEVYVAALREILNPANHPMLIHCNKGKHRTGCLIGCLRKVQRWSLTIIFDEYRRFAEPKPRFLDQQFIELFDTTELQSLYQEFDLMKLAQIKSQKEFYRGLRTSSASDLPQLGLSRNISAINVAAIATNTEVKETVQ